MPPQTTPHIPLTNQSQKTQNKVDIKHYTKGGVEYKIDIKRYTNGRIEYKTIYANNIKHGVQTAKRRGGTKAWDVTWVKGNMRGMETWWWESGQKSWAVARVDNKMHGVETEWYKNGRKKKEVYFLLNAKYARLEWNEKGTLLKIDFPNPGINQTLPKIHNFKNHIKEL